MSEIKSLIDKFCPNGVVYKRVGDIAEVGTGSSNGNEASDEGAYPFFIRSQTVKAKDDYEYDEEAIIIPGEGGVGDIYHYINGKYAIHQRVYRIHFTTNEITTRFAYYCFNEFFKAFIMKKAVSATVTSIRKPMIQDFSIPIPPLPVQEEIVRILDNFTDLTAELQAELQARAKQYEYYRNQLILNTEGKEGKLIDMLSQPVTDGPHTTPVLYADGVPFVSATAVYDGRVHLEDMKGYISKEFDDECSKKYKPRRNDVFMVKSGSTTGKVAFVDFDDDFNVWSPLAAMRTNEDNSPRYLYHLLQTLDVQNQVQERMSHGSQPNLSMRVLEQFDVKIPSLEKQLEIVEILDRMDSICNDIFSGLPAEIEARQKQYEYYRNKLLTFKELG